MENRYEIIEQYLSGTLTGEALSAFKSNLELDDNLREEVDLIQGIRQTVSTYNKIKTDEEELRVTLTKVGEKYFSETPDNNSSLKLKRPLIAKIAIAASIAILAIVGLFFWNKQQYNVATLVASYRVETTNLNRSEVDIIDPETVINAPDDQYLYYQYLYAEQMMLNHTYEKAKAAYTIVLKNQNNSDYITKEINFEAVRWNLILIDLALGKDLEVNEQLDNLLKSSISNKYKLDAQSLQQKINSIWFNLAN